MKKLLALAILIGASLSASYAQTMFCTEEYNPVCAQKNAILKTYSNPCFAKVDGARIVYYGMCVINKPQFKLLSLKDQQYIDKVLQERLFNKIKNKSILEQLKVLQEKLNKINEVKTKLKKINMLSELVKEVLDYLYYKIEGKIVELKKKLGINENILKGGDSDSLLKSVLEESY